MNFGYALGKGLEAGANAGAQVMDNTMREQAEVRAADRRLADRERLMAAQELMNIRAGERAQSYKVDDETRADARLTDPERAKKIAQAGEAGANIKAQGEIDRTIDLAGNQSYLSAARKLKQNEQITSPAQALALESAKLDLESKKTLLVKQDALRAAMASGDKKEEERLVREIAVLSGKSIDPTVKDFTEREKARAHGLEATLRDPDATPEEKKAARAELDRLTAPPGTKAADPLAALGEQIKALQAKKATPAAKPLMDVAREANAAEPNLYDRSGQAARGAAEDKRAEELAALKARADADPDVVALRRRRAQVAQSGDPREINKIVGEIQQIMKQRYGL